MRIRQQERPLAAHSWATLHRLLGAGTQLMMPRKAPGSADGLLKHSEREKATVLLTLAGLQVVLQDSQNSWFLSFVGVLLQVLS